MVRRSQGEVRQSRQKKASSTKGTVSRNKDSSVVPECQPTNLKAEQDQLRDVVREERATVSTPVFKLGGIEIKSGSFWYNRRFKTIVQYKFRDPDWVFRMALIGEGDLPDKPGTPCGFRMGRVCFAIRNRELFEVPEERVILTFLTKKNHLEEYVNADGHTEVS